MELGAPIHSRSRVTTSDSPGSLSRPPDRPPHSPDSLSRRQLHRARTPRFTPTTPLTRGLRSDQRNEESMDRSEDPA